MIRGNLGILEQEAGNFAEAREQYDAALDEFSQSGARLYEGHLRGYSAALHHEQRALEQAIDGYEEAILILRAVGDRRLEGLFSAAAGGAEAARERVLRAEEHFRRAFELLDAVGDPGLLAALELHRGQLAIAESRIAGRRGETERAHEQRTIALLLITRLKASTATSDDARFALRLLERELSSMTLTYDPALRTLTPPGGEVVDLSTRVPLCRHRSGADRKTPRSSGPAAGRRSAARSGLARREGTRRCRKQPSQGRAFDAAKARVA